MRGWRLDDFKEVADDDSFFSSPSSHKIKCLVTLKKVNSHGKKKSYSLFFSEREAIITKREWKEGKGEGKMLDGGDENSTMSFGKLFLVCIARDEHRFHPFFSWHIETLEEQNVVEKL